MTVLDLWNMWSDLEDDTKVDVYTSGCDLLEIGVPMRNVCKRFGKMNVYTFGSTAKPNRKIITIEV